MALNNPYSVYKKNSVNYASKEQLLLMLVEGAVKFIKIARQGILDKNVKVAHENMIKAQNIYYELMISLDEKSAGKWAVSLKQVYDFIIKKLVEANIKKDVSIIDNEILPLAENIKDTWEQAYEISKSGNPL
ncbi:flagellar export chaperone FliS [Clostridium oryzae]|uniref:Flagellar secretion chaperone FliS n=1 Tax=Clostridium oryzae TaxID=1450648 RepID=A0A1V4ILY3_9CLOT|nr:flagellar export chaperone FliS [Clostridium oryzae]OPJ60879.1 flagellar protein FliS [Clostridium oryzae]